MFIRQTTRSGQVELLDRLPQRLGKRLAPPTIYRPLDFLVSVGLAHRLASTHSFVACADPSQPHQAVYLVCERCGDAQEPEAPALESLISRRAIQKVPAARAGHWGPW